MKVAPIAISMVEPVAAATHWCVTDLASETTRKVERPPAYDARMFVFDMCAEEALHAVLTNGLHAVARCADNVARGTLQPGKCVDDP